MVRRRQLTPIDLTDLSAGPGRIGVEANHTAASPYYRSGIIWFLKYGNGMHRRRKRIVVGHPDQPSVRSDVLNSKDLGDKMPAEYVCSLVIENQDDRDSSSQTPASCPACWL